MTADFRHGGRAQAHVGADYKSCMPGLPTGRSIPGGDEPCQHGSQTEGRQDMKRAKTRVLFINQQSRTVGHQHADQAGIPHPAMYTGTFIHFQHERTGNQCCAGGPEVDRAEEMFCQMLPHADSLASVTRVVRTLRQNGRRWYECVPARSIHESSAAAADRRENTARAPSWCSPYCEYDCAPSSARLTVFSHLVTGDEPS